MRKFSTVVLFSGGIDSALCVLLAKRDFGTCAALTVDYGQARGELEAAYRLASQWKLDHLMATVSAFPGSLDPQGTNLIPGRNTMLLSLAIATLEASQPGTIFIGANADDRRDYPDCRDEFFLGFEQVCRLQGLKITVNRPLINWTKAKVVKEARRRGIPIHDLVSCYAGVPACGICNACILRATAIAEAHLAE